MMESVLAMQTSTPGLEQRIRVQAAALKTLATRCDAMCLTAGVRLTDAVPGLHELAGRFLSLSKMLVDDESLQPVRSLEAVARDIVEIGTAMATERDAVTKMTKLNHVLARRIGDLVDSVRFLSAVVSNIKIEIAAINERDMRLEGFVDNLKQLAIKSSATVEAFKTTHGKMDELLRRTAAAQSIFVATHGAKLETASHEIRSSLEAVWTRRRAVSDIASDVGTITRQIADQIAQCVVALQMGDSTSQRLEHAGGTLEVAAELVSGRDIANVIEPDIGGDEPALRAGMGGQVCRLSSLLVRETTGEFVSNVRDVKTLIEQISSAGRELVGRSGDLVASPGDKSRGFLADLEGKLASAHGLIDECSRSRRLVDGTAEQMVAAFLDLRSLADSVASMAIDMTIIGTNAVVTSYRLGSKGIPLSVIAQSLRSQAVQITDAVKLVNPAVGHVLDAAQAFTAARKGQNAGSMESLTKLIADAIAAFRAGDGTVLQVHDCLEAEVAGIGNVLLQARAALGGIDKVDLDLQDGMAAIEDIIDECPLPSEASCGARGDAAVAVHDERGTSHS